MSGFIRNETGAVTVDWVVLTAALVGLGLAVMGTVSIGVQDTSTDIREQLETDMIVTRFGDAYTNYSACNQASYDSHVALFGGNAWAHVDGDNWGSHVSGMTTNVTTAATADPASPTTCSYADQLAALVAVGEDKGYMTDDLMDGAVGALEIVEGG